MNFGNFTTLVAAYEAGKARGASEYLSSPSGEIFVKNPNSPGGILFRRSEQPQYWAEMPDNYNFVPFDMEGAQALLWEGLKPCCVYNDEFGPCFNRPELPLATRQDLEAVPCDVASIWEALPPGEILVLADGVFQISESGVLEEI